MTESALTDRHKDILRHMLGLDDAPEGREPVPFRNYYVAGDGHHAMPLLKDLVASGHVQEVGSVAAGQQRHFMVTRAGFGEVYPTTPADKQAAKDAELQARRKVSITLHTAAGFRFETDLSDLQEAVDPKQVIRATFAVGQSTAVSNKPYEYRLSIDGNAWRSLVDEIDVDNFVVDLFGARITSADCIESALRAQLDWMVNHYTHDECDEVWSDEYSCACDDDCPSCGASCSPHSSDGIRVLEETEPGLFELKYSQAALEQPDNQAAAERPRAG